MRRLLFALALLLVSAPVVLAQSATGTILGTVQDASAAAIPDAKVTITATATNISRTVNTGSDGSYRVDALTPGEYTITIEKQGFGAEKLTSVTLEVAQTLRENAALKVGSVSESVDISADVAPQVDTTTSSLGGMVNSQQVADLPLNGRNFVDLALLQPGVTNVTNNGPNLNATFFSSNGAPIRSNNTMLDGAPMMSVKGTTASAVGTTLGVDGIQEFRVLTNSFGAQYGISVGSQIVIASKGGSNKWHGDAFDYLRNNYLDAWGYFAKSAPKLIKNNFGGSFGGPIKKDKTFFYGVYEAIRQIAGTTSTVTTLPSNCNPNGSGGTAVLTINPCAVSATNPTGAVNQAIAPFLHFYPVPNTGTNQYIYNPVAPTQVDYGQMRVDQRFSDKDSLFGRITIDRANLLSSASYAGTEYQQVGTATVGKDVFMTAGETHTFTSSILNSLRVSYSRTIQNTTPAYPASFNSPLYSQVYNQPMGGLAISSGLSGIGPPGNVPQQFSQNLYSLSDDVNWNKGKHAIQIGTMINRIEYYTNNTLNLRGATTFGSLAGFLAGTYTAATFITPGSDTLREPRFYTMGVYIQDDWRANPRLTLNLGLRYEPASVPYDRHGANWSFKNMTDATPVYGPIMRNDSRRNFGPRVGFNWDVFGSGKTAIRGAFGEYFDVNAFGFTFYTTGQGTPPLSTVITYTGGTVTSFPLVVASQALVPGKMPYGAALHTTNYATNQPHLLSWNASISQQLTKSLALTVAYVGTRGIHLWDTEEGNPCLPSGTDSRGLPTWTNPNVAAPANAGGTTHAAGVLPDPLNPGKTAPAVCNTISNPGTANAALVTANDPNGTKYIVPTRLNPLWGDWVLLAPNADSYYHAVQFTVTKRATHGLEGQAAYTYSKTTDDAQGLFNTTECSGSGGIPSQVLQPTRKVYDTGPACFDVPHQFQMSILYHVPKTNLGGFVGREVLNGWWLGNKTTYTSGFPFGPQLNNWRSFDQNVTSNNNGAGSTDYVSYGTTTVAPGQTGVNGDVNTTGVTFVPYDKKTVLTKTVKQWYNPLMFTMNSLGTLGTATKNSALRGPHYAVVDLSINKDTAIPLLGEKGMAEFRVEAFNLFNHTNLALPSAHNFTGALTNSSIYSEAPISTGTTPGQITAIVGQPRQIQLSLKVLF